MGPSRTKDHHHRFKRSIREALVRSEPSGSWNERANMTNATVYKELMQITQNDYLHALEMWYCFATTLDDDWIEDPHNFRTAKAFVSVIASGISSRERGSKPSQSSVIQSWKNLITG